MTLLRLVVTRAPYADQPAGWLSWPAAWCFGVLVLLKDVLVFGLVRADCPVVALWLACGVFFVLSTALLWRFHLSQWQRLNASERFNMSLYLGFLIANPTLLVVTGPLDPGASSRGALAWYPALAVLGGFAIFLHGSTHWGRLYLWGLAHMPLAVLFRFVPEWA